MNQKTILWLRAESRIGERRTILIPEHAGALVRAGYEVYVENSPLRIYPDAEYAKHGCKIEPNGTWQNAPDNAMILGLKEIPVADFPLQHKHFYAGHCFDGETEASALLRRFDAGGGILYSFETLLNASGRQLGAEAAGRIAGIAGALLALSVWRQKRDGAKPPYTPPILFTDLPELKKYLAGLDLSELRNGEQILVVAPNGNVGKGVRSILDFLKIPYAVWMRGETAEATRNENFRRQALTKFQVMFNCISLDNLAPDAVTPILLTHDDLATCPDKKLTVISDISACPDDPRNTLPIYTQYTTLSNPTIQVDGIDIIAVDNLPTVLPKDCTDCLSTDLIAQLLLLLQIGDNVPNTPYPYAVKRFREAPR